MLLTLLRIEQWARPDGISPYNRRRLIDSACTVLPEGGGIADQRRALRDAGE